MRIAVISDIHGNWHALDAVLNDIEHEGVDEVWCLKDVVGYGPQPNRCVAETLAPSRSQCLMGNHDLAAVGRVDLDGLLARRSYERDVDDRPSSRARRITPSSSRPSRR